MGLPDWSAATRPGSLLSLLRGKPAPSDRKFRLFAVACCRRVAEHIPDIALVEVIDGCERLAEHLDGDDWNPRYLSKLRWLADRVGDAVVSVPDPVLDLVLAKNEGTA